MNCYIIVEGARTEMSVIPAWISIVAPKYTRIFNVWDIKDNNYYLFSAGGIPSIYNHIKNAVCDINKINNESVSKYNYLLVCVDTENETRDYHLHRIYETLKADDISLNGTQIVLLEQKICIETWFLGNRRIYKNNPQNVILLEFTKFYDVSKQDPENMNNIDINKFSTTAKFHLRYLKEMFKERNVFYSKSNTTEVEKEIYLNTLVKRYNDTGHIASFGRWYKFIQSNFV